MMWRCWLTIRPDNETRYIWNVSVDGKWNSNSFQFSSNCRTQNVWVPWTDEEKGWDPGLSFAWQFHNIDNTLLALRSHSTVCAVSTARRYSHPLSDPRLNHTSCHSAILASTIPSNQLKRTLYPIIRLKNKTIFRWKWNYIWTKMKNIWNMADVSMKKNFLFVWNWNARLE